MFQRAAPYGAVIRAAFDGERLELSHLPEQGRSEPMADHGGDDGFWPDFIPPDD